MLDAIKVMIKGECDYVSMISLKNEKDDQATEINR